MKNYSAEANVTFIILNYYAVGYYPEKKQNIVIK